MTDIVDVQVADAVKFIAKQPMTENETPESRAREIAKMEADLRAKAGLPAPKTPKADKPEETAKPALAEAKTEDKPDKPKVDPMRIAKATEALRRYGMTAKQIDKMDEEDILTVGEHQLKIQKDNDEFRTDVLSKLGKAKESGADAKTPAKPKDDTDALRKRFADEFGEEFLPLLSEAREDHSETVAALQARVEEMALNELRRDLVDEIPEFKDRTTFSKAVKFARAIRAEYGDGEAGERKFREEYPTDADCILSIARNDMKLGAKPAAKKETFAERSSGLLDTGTVSTPGAKGTKAELRIQGLMAREQGNQAEAKRLFALSDSAPD